MLTGALMAQTPVSRKVRHLTSEQNQLPQNTKGENAFLKAGHFFQSHVMKAIFSWHWLLFSFLGNPECQDGGCFSPALDRFSPPLVFWVWPLATASADQVVKKIILCLAFHKLKNSRYHLAFLISIWTFVWMDNGLSLGPCPWLWLCVVAKHSGCDRGRMGATDRRPHNWEL